NLRFFCRDCDRRDTRQALADLLAQFCDVKRKFLCARGSFSIPEGHGRWRTMRIFDKDAPGFAFYSLDAPGSVAEQHDVAGVAFDCEVFVESSYDYAFRLGNDCDQGSFRNRTAAGDCRETCSTAGTQLMIHAVTVQISAVTSTTSRDAFGGHFENRVESFAGES